MLIVENNMVSDPNSDDKKCGDEGSAHRTFELRGADAQEKKCKEECEKDEKCVAFSAIWNDWCIGCDVELSFEHDKALGFKKKGD